MKNKRVRALWFERVNVFDPVNVGCLLVTRQLDCWRVKVGARQKRSLSLWSVRGNAKMWESDRDLSPVVEAEFSASVRHRVTVVQTVAQHEPRRK